MTGPGGGYGGGGSWGQQEEGGRCQGERGAFEVWLPNLFLSLGAKNELVIYT